MLKNEWKKLFQSKFMVVVMIAVMLIPTIYTAIFVGAMWDPYGNTENLPVAVVNKDKAVTYNEKELNVGEDLVENLRENNSLGFHFVDENEAAEGLAKGDYYMVITIPEDFSKNVTTLTEDKTKKMQLYYETNPGQNYIASKMSETAIKEIQANIREKITTQYTETMFEQLGTIGDGFVEAADGALQITDGTDQLLDGNQQIGDGLNTLAEGTLTLKKGGTELQTGLDTYTKGVGTLEQGAATLDSKSNELNQGVESVSEGITSLKGGSGAILAGMKTMSKELSKSLSKENMKTMEQLENGLTAMNDGIQQLNTSVQGMNVGSQLTETVGAVEGGLTSIGGSLGSAQTNLGTLQQTLTGLYTRLVNAGTNPAEALAIVQELGAQVGAVGTDVSNIAATTQGMADTLTEKKPALTAATTGLESLKTNVATLAANSSVVLPGSSQAITKLTTGLQSVQTALTKEGSTAKEMGLIQAMSAVDAGLGQLDTGVNGENGLKAGVSAYTAGVSSVSAGTKELAKNSDALVNGAGKLTDGAQALNEGALQLEDGSEAMGDGLKELKDGSITLADSLSDAGDEVNSTKTDEDAVDMFAAPVESVGSEHSHIENNGSAMAAYMMGVGLWVACIAFCTIYPLSKPSTEKVKNGFSWWFSKASVYLTVSVIQAVVMIFMLKLILGFQPKYLGKTVLVAVMASLAFMSVMYFFNVCFGKVGSYLMLIFMVLQLGGSAGTYPLELSSDFYHKLHERMPFTYSVNAFRATISTGNDIMPQLTIFIGMIVVFNLLSLAVFLYKSKKGQTVFKAEMIAE